MNHPAMKLASYLLMGVCTILYAALTGYDKAIVKSWDWYDWTTIVLLPLILNAVKDWRTFVDGSYTRYKDAQQPATTVIIPPPQTPTPASPEPK